jgi:hypothetical protein
MKNVFLIPTEKPSRLFIIDGKLYNYHKPQQGDGVNEINQHIYITSDEEIKKGNWCINTVESIVLTLDKKTEKAIPFESIKKIILTTDQDLINDGVQAIDDEFLEWFVKNPSCEFVEVKHKDIIQYGNMTMHDHNGDGSYYFCTNCEVETSRSKGELLKFGVEYYKIIIPQEEPKQTIEEDEQQVMEKYAHEFKQETLYTEEQVKLAYMQGYNRGKDGNPNHMESYIEFLKQNKKD